MVDHNRSRRRMLGLLGGVVGATALDGAGVAISNTTGAASQNGAPAIEWRQSYQGPDEEYNIQRLEDVRQTEAGGYALPGDGAPVHETGPEDEQFLLVKTNEDGDQQWVAFANTERDTEDHTTTDGVQTTDGGYGVVGYEEYRYSVEDPSSGGETTETSLVAAAGSVDQEGETQWSTTIQGTQPDKRGGEKGGAMFWAAQPADDGGFLACGSIDGNAWLVKFAADGTTSWERRYDYPTPRQLFARDSGYLLVTTDGDEDPYALNVSEDGELQGAVSLDVDRDETPHNHVFAPTADGGYAYTGRDSGRENMVLGKVNGEGERQWREEYDGPYEGRDWAFDVIQTADGGYALGGHMSEAYSGDSVPTVLKTDESGTEEWRNLLEEEAAANSFDSLVQTDDEGYACQIENTLVKLAPAAESRQTETATDSPTDATPETETETDPATDTPTESETTTDETPADGTRADEPTATETDTPTAPETETDDELPDDGSGEDCPTS